MVPSLAVLGGSPRRFPLFIVASIICVVVFVYLWRHTYEDSSSYFSIEGEVHPTFNLESQPRRHLRTHVAVASLFIFHFDVYLAAAHTIRDVLGDQGTVDVFAVDQPYPFGFQEVIDRLDLYSREVRDTKDLLDVLSATDFYPDEPGAMVDLLLLGTCEIDLRTWSDQLLKIWDARPADKKFKVACVVHDIRDTAWQPHITPWAARGAIRLLPIADHVGKAFRAYFEQLADRPNPEFLNAMYEYVQIDVHVPVLELPEYGVRSNGDKLSRAVIQGTLETFRRDYAHTFEDLLDALNRDPGAWGYLPLDHGRDEYVPVPLAEEEPFTLHIVGHGHIDMPKELKHVVKFHIDLDYVGFYAVMQSMDVVIPAFVAQDYFDKMASSSVAMAVECNIPMLVTQRMRKAYGYIDDDRVTITRPQALRDIPVIEAFRRGEYTPEHSTEGPLPGFVQDVDSMLSGGWRKSDKDLTSFKEQLWAQNRKAVSRILNDQPGVL